MSDHTKLLSKYLFIPLTIIFLIALFYYHYAESKKILSTGIISSQDAEALFISAPLKNDLFMSQGISLLYNGYPLPYDIENNTYYLSQNMNNNDLLNKYKRGIISYEEYEKLSKEDLDIKLSNKLDKEYEDFCKELMRKDKTVIFDKAYEKTVKEELKEEIKNMDLHDREKEIMLKVDNLLDEFYKDWLDCDIPLGESLRDNLQDSVVTLTRYASNFKKTDVER